MLNRIDNGKRWSLAVMAVSVLALAWASSAQALYLDFADFRGAATGNTAHLEIEGHGITIVSQPSNFDLSITNSGLGVSCEGGFLRCLGNSGSQIDAGWNESIQITFDDGPVHMNEVVFSQVYIGETAIVTAGGQTSQARGSLFDSTPTVDLGGRLVQTLTMSTTGLFSDISVQGIDFDFVVPTNPTTGGPRPGPTNPVPEPGAALLFGAGIAIVAARPRIRV